MTKKIDDNSFSLRKLPTGIVGFDQITHGGLPKNRSTLISGTAGCGKTLLGLQYIFEGANQFDEAGVIVTFEETPDDLMRNVQSFGWDLAALVKDSKIAIVDATPDPGEVTMEAGAYDLSAMLARIENAIRKVDANRVLLDSIGSIFSQFSDPAIVRRELQRVIAGLRELSVTTILNLERTVEYGGISRFGVEEFVADNVIILRNPLDDERRRRTIEILKFRGTTHQKGEYPFTIDVKDGLTIMPLSSIELGHSSSDVRKRSGNEDLDKMCGGGFFRDSIILVSGATGTGKTLLVAEFSKAAIEDGERALIFAFEESKEQLTRNATAWGIDFQKAQEDGNLRLICRYPETMSLEDHFVLIKREFEEYKPDRVAIDSLSALERISTARSFREFVIGVTSFVKHQDIPGMFTNTTSFLMGSESITETNISTITDSIILLRYVEILGQMRRGMMVLKMRGSYHEKTIREYIIGPNGMSIRGAFVGVGGILSGTATISIAGEVSKLNELFDQDGEG